MVWNERDAEVLDDCGPAGMQDTTASARTSSTPSATQTTPGVTFRDPTCNDQTAAIVYNEAPGVRYEVEGTVGPGQTVKVTGIAKDGYTIAGVDPRWSHTFGAVPTNCTVTPPPPPAPPPPTPPPPCVKCNPPHPIPPPEPPVCRKIQVNAHSFRADDKVRILVVRIGSIDGAKVYIRGANIKWTMKKTVNGYVSVKFVAHTKGIIVISSPRACREARVSVTPPPPPPAG